MRTLALSVLLVVGFAVAGCLAPQDEPPSDETTETAYDPFPRVVIAVIDSPVNVYHEHFQQDESLPDHVLDTFANSVDSEPPTRVELSKQGDFETRMEEDKSIWDGLESEKLYYFEGTNIMGINLGGGENILRPGSHGTAVAGSITDMNPDAIIVLVQGFGQTSEQWAATQPWVDFMSMSYGPPAGGPLSDTPASTQIAWQDGKIPVGAADNSPQPAINDGTAGPPWVVGVAGDHPAERCREHVSALVPDFTANFTQTLPRHDSVEDYSSTSGTSFATPTTAGVMSRALLEVRQAWNHTDGITDGALAVSPDGQRLTNSDLRATFNQTAAYFDTQLECDSGLASLPVNPVAPWLQQGWGNIGPETVEPTVNHILEIEAAPEKPTEAHAFMDALITYREAVWQTW